MKLGNLGAGQKRVAGYSDGQFCVAIGGSGFTGCGCHNVFMPFWGCVYTVFIAVLAIFGEMFDNRWAEEGKRGSVWDLVV